MTQAGKNRPCRCGHGIGLHGDRALWPACEGGAGATLPTISDTEWSFGLLLSKSNPRTRCPCPGYTEDA